MRSFDRVLEILPLVITLQGCSASQVQSAGAVTVGVGAVVTGVGFCVATGIDATKDDPTTPGFDPVEKKKAYPEEGLITMGAGLAVMVVGGIATGIGGSVRQGRPKTPPPMSSGGNAYWRLRR